MVESLGRNGSGRTGPSRSAEYDSSRSTSVSGYIGDSQRYSEQHRHRLVVVDFANNPKIDKLENYSREYRVSSEKIPVQNCES